MPKNGRSDRKVTFFAPFGIVGHETHENTRDIIFNLALKLGSPYGL
jgi:hypothetical protein